MNPTGSDSLSGDVSGNEISMSACPIPLGLGISSQGAVPSSLSQTERLLLTLTLIMSTTKPAVVLVHGAWHRPLHYALLAYRLRRAGYDVAAPANASVGAPTEIAGKTHLDDAAAVVAAMRPFLDAGREVVLVAHSYGGTVAGEVVVGNTVEERKAAGKSGGVKGILYIAAYVLSDKGKSHFEALVGGFKLPGTPPVWFSVDEKVGLRPNGQGNGIELG
jgi:pimeloyl-ACP methyl ester carboxylesterase